MRSLRLSCADDAGRLRPEEHRAGLVPESPLTTPDEWSCTVTGEVVGQISSLS